MNEIMCPRCKTVFQLDESGYADIVKQVRDREFADELAERVELLSRERDQAIALERADAQALLQERMAQRDAELSRVASERDAKIAELTARLKAAEGERTMASERAAAQARAESQEKAAELQHRVDELSALLAQSDGKSRLEQARAREEERDRAAAEQRRLREDAERELGAVRERLQQEAARAAQLQAQLDEAAGARELAVAAASSRAQQEMQERIAQSEREAVELRSRLASQQGEAELARVQAVAAVERERDEARASLERERAVRDSERQQVRAAHELELEQARKASAELIRYKDEEIERLRDMKARLSTKMVGETLEQHCETEFNRIRAAAFPQAYFEKDNDASGGTKGDFIFRECDGDGNEVISIMFEMKNENDTTATKHKNEDFFKKLDHDRTQKGCEYAILVTLLEPESELYNAGIVDVSHRYPKMYVIRPQFFIPMITLLRNAALTNLEAKRELALQRQQNIDVTMFEEKLLSFQDGFARNYDLASRKFQTAIDEIDTTIKHLQKVKDNLISSENNLRLANDKAQGLTIRKLTRGNKTMKEAFDEARAARGDRAEE